MKVTACPQATHPYDLYSIFNAKPKVLIYFLLKCISDQNHLAVRFLHALHIQPAPTQSRAESHGIYVINAPFAFSETVPKEQQIEIDPFIKSALVAGGRWEQHPNSTLQKSMLYIVYERNVYLNVKYM